MACKIIKDKDGNIVKVLAPNGKESNLFNAILSNISQNIKPGVQELDVIDSFKRKMEGIDFVFSQSPELASIGSRAQYLQYLSTIFPNSKVKDIVYHGTNLNFDKFDKDRIGSNTAVKGEKPSFSFSNNRKQAEAYSSEITVGQNTNELASVWFEENQHIFKNGDITTGVIDENNVIEHYKKELENSKEMVSPTREIDPLTNKYKLIPVNNKTLKQLAEIKTKEWQKEYNTLLTASPRIMSVIIDVKNPKIVDFKGEKKSIKFKEEQKNTIGDAFIVKNIDDWGKGDTIQVFEPEQIHILSSKADIQGFKEFVDTQLPLKISNNRVNYILKAVNIISKNIDKIKSWENNKSIKQEDLWNKIQQLGIPKEQIELLKNSDGNTIEEKLLDFTANYSYTVEANTAKALPDSLYDYETGFEYNGIQYGEDRYTGEYWYVDEFGDNTFISEKEYKKIQDSARKNIPSQHYSNLTVSGGTNYTENEISTPLITPSIKGHAQFSTDNGIGWFRSDDKLKNKEITIDDFSFNWEGSYYNLNEEKTKAYKDGIQIPYNDWIKTKIIAKADRSTDKTRRILEVQSDLFQKGRDKKDLITTTRMQGVGQAYSNLSLFTIDGMHYYSGMGIAMVEPEDGSKKSKKISFKEYEEAKTKWINQNTKQDSSENQFLQLLNKDNNWVTFFIKSIIQDSAKKGYEKVLFPSGSTASKVEGHTTLEGFKKQKEDRIKELEKIENEYTLKQKEDGTWDIINSLGRSEGYSFASKGRARDEIEKTVYNAKNEITQLKQELERVEREGFGALRPIFNFYETTVTNILKKQGYNPTLIIDEYGNTWNEITIDQVRDLSPIPLSIKRPNVDNAVTEWKRFYTPAFRERFGDWINNPETFDLDENGEPRVVGNQLLGPNNTTEPISDISEKPKKLEDERDTRAAEIFKEVFNNSSEDLTSKELISRLLNAGYIPNHLIPIAKLLQKVDMPVSFVDSFGYDYIEASMVFNVVNDDSGKIFEILLNRWTFTDFDSKQDFATTFLHEVVHGYTYKALKNPTTKEEAQFKKRIEHLFEISKKLLNNDTSKFYGISNPIEFVAEIMTDEELQRALFIGTPVTQKQSEGLLKRFIKFILELLGFKANEQAPKNVPITEQAMKDVILHVKKAWSENEKISSVKSVNSNISGSRGFVYTTSVVPYMMNGKRITKDDFIKRLKEVLILQKEIYKDRKQSTKLISDIELLESLLAKGDEAAFVAQLVADAERYIIQMHEAYTFLKAKFENPNPTDEEIRETMVNLNEFKNLAAAYTILDDIERFLDEHKTNLKSISKLVNKDEKQYLDYLSGLIRERDKLLANYMNHAVHVLTEWIYPYAEYTNKKLQESGEDEKFILTKETIKEFLTESPKDISVVNSALGAVINSPDPINALIAKIVAKQLDEARMADLNNRNFLMDEYVKKSGPKDSPHVFNASYIQEIELPSGEKVFAIQQEINRHEFDKNKSAFFKLLEENGIKPGTAKFAQLLGRWYNSHTELRPDYKEYIEHLKKVLKPAEFEAFMQKNTREVDLSYRSPDPSMIYSTNGPYARVFKGAFIVPKRSKYLNKNFVKLMQDPYFARLHKVYTEANKKLPRARRLRYGMLPQVPKSSLDGILEYGMDVGAHLDRIKELWRKKGTTEGQDEKIYGRQVYQNLAGEIVQFLPIYYTTKLEDQKEVSKDLLTSVLLFSEMANKFDAYYDIFPHINTLQTVVLGSPLIKGSGRKVLATVPGTMEKLVNKVTGVDIKKEESRANKRLKHFLDSIFWGHENLKIEINVPGIGLVNVDKFLDKFGALNAVATMAGNFVSALDNVVIGNINTIIESTLSKHTSLATYGEAVVEFGKLMVNGDILSDVGKEHDKSMIGQLIDLYDAIQGEFSDDFGRDISGSRAKNLFSLSHLTFLNHIGEYQIQVTAMISKMLNTKVKTSDGKEISLYRAYQLVDGKLALKPGVQWSETDRFMFMKELHGMNKDLQGNYNSFDKSTLQRYAVGRLALMFRKYIYSSYNRWWGSVHVDYEQNKVRGGHHSTFLLKLLEEMKAGHPQILYNWDKLNMREREAFLKTYVSIGLFLVTALLFGWLDDDEEKNKFDYHLLLQLRRLQANLLFFMVPSRDAIRLLKTPAIALDYYTKVWDLSSHVLTEWDEEDLYYKRKYGPNEVGDRKAWAKLKRLAPVIRGLEVSQYPEEQLKVFQSSGK